MAVAYTNSYRNNHFSAIFCNKKTNPKIDTFIDLHKVCYFCTTNDQSRLYKFTDPLQPRSLAKGGASSNTETRYENIFTCAPVDLSFLAGR